MRHAKEDFLPLKDAAASAKCDDTRCGASWARDVLALPAQRRGGAILSGAACALDIVKSMKSIKGKHDPGNDKSGWCEAKSGLNSIFLDEKTPAPPTSCESGALVTASNRAFLDEDVADAKGDACVVQKCKK